MCGHISIEAALQHVLAYIHRCKPGDCVSKGAYFNLLSVMQQLIMQLIKMRDPAEDEDDEDCLGDPRWRRELAEEEEKIIKKVRERRAPTGGIKVCI